MSCEAPFAKAARSLDAPRRFAPGCHAPLPWEGDLASEVAGLGEFSAVVGKVYDAAVEPEGWPAALDAIRGFADAKTAVLMSHDVFDKAPPWELEVGHGEYWTALYHEKYAALNPFMDEVALLESGEQIYASSRTPYATLFESEFYQGWLKPQGLIDATLLVVERSMNHITTLANIRSDGQGVFDDEGLARIRLLYPHLRRAMLIGRAFEDHRKRLANDAAVLDSLAAAMFLLSPRGEVLQANAAGEAMLTSRSPLRASNGRLEFASGSAQRALGMALAAGRDGDVGLGGKGASIPVRVNDGASSEYVAHLLPLNAARQRVVGAEQGAGYVLFVRRIGRDDIAAVDAFAERFGLTAKEATVLQTVVEVGGVPQAADVLGLSPSTVRTHVTSIFDKSGVRRQADLIRLLMEMKSPFAGSSAGLPRT
jgi:DNA-binding CsgD family transcriptional regulator